MSIHKGVLAGQDQVRRSRYRPPPPPPPPGRGNSAAAPVRPAITLQEREYRQNLARIKAHDPEDEEFFSGYRRTHRLG